MQLEAEMDAGPISKLEELAAVGDILGVLTIEDVITVSHATEPCVITSFAHSAALAGGVHSSTTSPFVIACLPCYQRWTLGQVCSFLELI